jgi:cell division protein FtsN
VNGELQRRRAQRAPKGPTGKTFFSKFTSPQRSYAAALRQDKQNQQPQTTQTEQQYLPQKEFQKTELSVQATSSSNNNSVATVVHQIMTTLTKAVSEEDRVMVITKLVLNLLQQNGCYNS